MSTANNSATPAVLVVAIHPNGDVQTITTRQELAWARAEGLKPFMLGSPEAIAAVKERAKARSAQQ